MKNYKILFVNLFLALIISCKPSTEDAIKFNNGITEQQILVNEQMSKLLDSYDTYVAEEMENAYSAADEQLNKSIKYVSDLKGFGEDTYFKEGALTFLNTYKAVLETEHKKIIGLLKLPEDSYGSNQVKEVETMRNQSNIKIDKALDDMFIIQKKFTDKYHIKLENE